VVLQLSHDTLQRIGRKNSESAEKTIKNVGIYYQLAVNNVMA
jgi:phage head maturation protease